MLNSILTYTETGAVTLQSALLCTLAALALGTVAACFYMIRNTASKGFVVALALLPAIVQVVILMVNGNLGTGVAVMGAFSLVRFRSVPGSAREITSIFLAMAIGLATGMGALGFAALFTLLLCLMQLVLFLTPFGKTKAGVKELRVTIPENLDYCGLFDDLFTSFTHSAELLRVRTAGMGSMYDLVYQITLKNEAEEKRFLDALRCRNGNLPVSCGRVTTARDEL